jgi:hypothetical protein
MSDLKDLYEQLGNLELDRMGSVLDTPLLKKSERHLTLAETAIDVADLSLGNPTDIMEAKNHVEVAEATGISTFRHLSSELQKAVCGDSELLPAAGITQPAMKQALESLLVGLGTGWASAIAGIAVYLFFDELKPKICAQWTEWNNAPHPDPYQKNPNVFADAFERIGVYANA